MLEKNADVNCCFLCSVIFIEYYSTMHCNEVLQACWVDPIYCDIFGAAERVLRYGLPINLRYIFKRVSALDTTNNQSLHNITEWSKRLATFRHLIRQIFGRFSDFWKIFRVFGSFPDFWKIFRYLEDFQIFRRFSDFWKIFRFWEDF